MRLLFAYVANESIESMIINEDSPFKINGMKRGLMM